MNQPMNSFLRAILTILRSDTTTLSGVWVGLYTAINASFGPNVTMANLTEASYTGYVRQQIPNWTTPYFNLAQRNAVTDGALHFSPGDASFPQTIIGVLFGSTSVAGGGTLLWADQLATPVGLTSPTTILNYVPEFDLDPAANYGTGSIIA